MTPVRSLSLGFGSLLLASALGCATQQTSMQIPLTWTPTNTVGELSPGALDAFHGKSVEVALGSDERPEHAKIGENREGDQPLPVTTQDDVPAFVQAHVAQVLKENALDVVPSGANRVIQVDLKDFFVDERDTYAGRVILGVTLKDGQGKTLWQGIAKGTNTRWGRSFAQDNYEQALSDSTLDAVQMLLKDPAFQKAVRGQ